jgi:molybdopterin-guanine dinucleotide biosynthesis protein A
MTGVILAGGEGKRMGGVNKAFMEVCGQRIIDRIVSIFKRLFRETMIVTNQPLDFAYLGIRIVSDLVPGKGALGGLFTGLFHSSSSHIFVAACDMPFLNPDLISYMIKIADDYDVCVPVLKEGMEPLHAIYSKRCLKPIERQIKKGDMRITSIYSKLKVRKLSEEELRDIDPSLLSFRNINTFEDYEKVKRTLIF